MADVPLFRFEDVTVIDSEARPILDRVTVSVPDATITVVVGPSGSGKTTLLRLCNRLEVAATGGVWFRGDDLATIDPVALRRRVGMVFQKATMLEGTVRDNLLVAAPAAEDATLGAMLERAELDRGVLDQDAATLSGGEAQRVCVARTMLTGPSVLLMDEPTAALDPAPRRGLEDLAVRLAGDGTPLLWVTHDVTQARLLADHVVVLVAGRVAAFGSAELLDGVEDGYGHWQDRGNDADRG